MDNSHWNMKLILCFSRESVRKLLRLWTETAPTRTFAIALRSSAKNVSIGNSMLIRSSKPLKENITLITQVLFEVHFVFCSAFAAIVFSFFGLLIDACLSVLLSLNNCRQILWSDRNVSGVMSWSVVSQSCDVANSHMCKLAWRGPWHVYGNCLSVTVSGMLVKITGSQIVRLHKRVYWLWKQWLVFTVRRYALHGLSYRNSVRPSVRHTRGLCPHGSTYDHDFFTIW